jgi:hypothetical protein
MAEDTFEIAFELGEGEGYLLRDGEGNWYISEDDTVGDDDLTPNEIADSLFTSDSFFGEENPFVDGDFFGEENPFINNENEDNSGFDWDSFLENNPFLGDNDNIDELIGNIGERSLAGNVPLAGEEFNFELENGDGYLLRNGEGDWYFSEDSAIDENDTTLNAGLGSILSSDNFFGQENPFTGDNNPFAGDENPFG